MANPHRMPTRTCAIACEMATVLTTRLHQLLCAFSYPYGMHASAGMLVRTSEWTLITPQQRVPIALLLPQGAAAEVLVMVETFAAHPNPCAWLGQLFEEVSYAQGGFAWAEDLAHATLPCSASSQSVCIY